jgi:hypothetical protein
MLDYRMVTYLEITKFSGTMQFSPGLIALNVLFVHDFNLNLLYLPKLCIDIDCVVNFDNDKCLNQETWSLNIIGPTDLIEGLYFLVTQASPQATLSSSQAKPHSTFIP